MLAERQEFFSKEISVGWASGESCIEGPGFTLRTCFDPKGLGTFWLRCDLAFALCHLEH
jgi:hypothetical protein